MLNVEELRGAIDSYLASNWGGKVSKQDREDIAQDTMIRLWKVRERIQQEKNPKSYAVAVCCNLVKDHLRSRDRRIKAGSLEELVEDDIDFDIPEAPRDIDFALSVEGFVDSLSASEREYWEFMAKGISLRGMTRQTGKKYKYWKGKAVSIEERWALWFDTA